MYKTRSPCAHPAGVARARPAPPRACVTPNSTPNSRPKSRRVKPCPNSTAGASSAPCWVGSPSPAAQASWLPRQRARPRSPALPPRHRRRDRAPSKRHKVLWSGRAIGGGAGGAGGAAAVAFAVGAGSSRTRLPEAGEPRRAGEDRPPTRGATPMTDDPELGQPAAKGERAPVSGFPSMSIGHKGRQECLSRNERG